MPLIVNLYFNESGQNKFNQWFKHIAMPGMAKEAIFLEAMNRFEDQLGSDEDLVYELGGDYTQSGRPELLLMERSDFDIEYSKDNDAENHNGSIDKVDFFRFCMEDGSVTWDYTGNTDGFLQNPLLKDLYIELFFPPMDKKAAQIAFAEVSADFTAAAIQVNRRSEYLIPSEFSEQDIEVIKETAAAAIAAFRAQISHSNPAPETAKSLNP